MADMGKTVYRLQDLFAEALVDASENYQMAEKNTTQEGSLFCIPCESLRMEHGLSMYKWMHTHLMV